MRTERNIVCRAFLTASKNHKCTRMAGLSSWIFTLYDRLHAHPVDSCTMPGYASGRLAYLKEVLQEVMSLGELMSMPGQDARTVTGAEHKVQRISSLIFGQKESDGKAALNAIEIINFCFEWLKAITDIQAKENDDGEGLSISAEVMKDSPRAVQAIGGRIL